MLTPGKILVYSIAQEKVLNRIPVDKSFDRLTFSPKQNRLIVTSSSKKTLKLIDVEFLQKIDITGLPYKGQKNAPVTIAVFNDYQ
jgi:WD40 repeat protein